MLRTCKLQYGGVGAVAHLRDGLHCVSAMEGRGGEGGGDLHAAFFAENFFDVGIPSGKFGQRSSRSSGRGGGGGKRGREFITAAADGDKRPKEVCLAHDLNGSSI